MIQGSCLVLNKSFMPIQMTSIKRALCLVFKDYAKIVDEQYQLYDFGSWSELSAHEHNEKINLTEKVIRVPRVILLNFYEKMPRLKVTLTRENIFLRDQNTCQYCGEKFKRTDLNLDHVLPVSQGGLTTWENIVCSCLPCNSHKGGRTPEQAKMKLRKKPVMPPHSVFMHVSPREDLLKVWKLYMNPVDFTYWNLELKE
jgi:5-methylcytosine-specific restriction endonuclease McrA